MNNSVCGNCVPKCIVVPLGKNPKIVDFFKPDYPRNYPLNLRSEFDQIFSTATLEEHVKSIYVLLIKRL